VKHLQLLIVATRGGTPVTVVKRYIHWLAILTLLLGASACDSADAGADNEGNTDVAALSGESCTTNPCQNGSVCSSEGDAISCACASGWAGDTCTECESREVCGYDEICHNASCEGVFGRAHRITILSLEVGSTDPDGDGWDVFGGAPDLLVSFGIVGSEACTTTKVQDAFSASWTESCEFTFTADDTFALEVYDSDLGGDYLAAGWLYEGTEALVALAASGEEMSLSSGDISLTYSVTPLY